MTDAIFHESLYHIEGDDIELQLIDTYEADGMLSPSIGGILS